MFKKKLIIRSSRFPSNFGFLSSFVGLTWLVQVFLCVTVNEISICPFAFIQKICPFATPWLDNYPSISLSLCFLSHLYTSLISSDSFSLPLYFSFYFLFCIIILSLHQPNISFRVLLKKRKKNLILIFLGCYLKSLSYWFWFFVWHWWVWLVAFGLRESSLLWIPLLHAW